jgi:hypothetical protein
MDAEMNRRWQAGESPFDGIRLFLEDPVPLCVLRSILTPAIDYLQRESPQDNLFCVHDWHEHDGCILKKRPVSWEDIRSWLSSDDALYAVGPGDDYVRVGIFPADRRYYVRLYIIVEGSLREVEGSFRVVEGRQGAFDLTGSEWLVEAVAKAAQRPGLAAFSREPAKAYFDLSWGG